MTGLIEQIRRAHPTIGSHTYRLLKGLITQAEYERLLNEERRRFGLPEIREPR